MDELHRQLLSSHCRRQGCISQPWYAPSYPVLAGGRSFFERPLKSVQANTLRVEVDPHNVYPSHQNSQCEGGFKRKDSNGFQNRVTA